MVCNRFDGIYSDLSLLKMAVYAPVNYIQPSRLKKYEELYDTKIEGSKGTLRQADRERSLQALMTTNLLKRLESSVEAFRLTLGTLDRNISGMLNAIERFEANGGDARIDDAFNDESILDTDDEDLSGLGEFTIGKKIKIDLSDMDLPNWKADLGGDREIILGLLAEMEKVGIKDDAKLQHVIDVIRQKMATPLNPRNRKVLIFTAYADTAEYLYKNIASHSSSLKWGRCQMKSELIQISVLR